MGEFPVITSSRRIPFDGNGAHGTINAYASASNYKPNASDNHDARLTLTIGGTSYDLTSMAEELADLVERHRGNVAANKAKEVLRG